MSEVYQVIYADPPWRYSFSKSKSRRIENQYTTMTIPEICALGKILPIADKAILYLWITMPKLFEAGPPVMEAWGFTYKTGAAWDKGRTGQGYYFRGEHELLLVGTRGGFSPPLAHLRTGSMIRERRSNVHSRKPVEARRKIEKAYPNERKLEVFAREANPGWDVYGNEAPDSIQLEGTLWTPSKFGFGARSIKQENVGPGQPDDSVM